MNDDRTRINRRNIICAVLCVLVAAALGILFYTNQQKEKAQTAALESLQEEVEPYESELRELQAELDDLKNDVSYSSEDASIMVGFVLSDASDVSYIKEKAKTYQFSPVIVIDCTMGMEEIEEIIKAADGDWEIMLYASNYSESVNEDVLSVLSYMESAEKKDTGILFLRADYSSESNIELLAEDGFLGYTSYHEESPASGQTDTGMVYFDYSYLTSSGTGVTSRLYSLYNSKSSMIVTFDMASINSGSLSETYVDGLLENMQYYTEYDDCSFSTVADVVQELSQINSVEADNQAAYEKQSEEIQKRIDELEDIIAGIYEKWDMEE